MVASMSLVPLTGNATIVSDDVISWWDCEETSGVRYDSNTTNSNDLTDNNTVGYSTGIVGNGCDFEKDNSESLSISDANQSGLDITGDHTISVWVKPETACPNFDMPILGKYAGSGDQRGYLIGCDPNSINLYHSSLGTDPSTQFAFITNTLGVATWHHIVYTYTAGASEVITLYEDAISIGSDDTYAQSIFNNSAAFYIGYNADVSQTYFDGLIDEIVIFDRVLTTDEIDDLYNAGSGVTYDDLFTTSTTSTSTATTTTSTTDVSELIWVMELYLSVFMYLIFTYIGYRFTKMFI